MSETNINALLDDITRLKKENEMLKLNIKKYELNKLDNDIYKNFFETNTAIMLLIDPENGDIIDASNEACNFYGYSKNEITAINICEINMMSTEELLYKMKSAVEKEQTQFSFNHRLSNGQIRKVEVKSGPVVIQGKKYLYSIVCDRTENEMMEQKLKASLEKQEKLMAFLPDAVFIINNGRIAYSNEFGINLLGYNSLEELLGINYVDIVHSNYKEIAKARLKFMECKNKIAPLIEKQYLKKSGEIVEVEVTGLKVPYENSFAFLLVARDISERKKVKKELDEKIEFENLRTEFFANISHELRTPLNVLLGSIQILALPGIHEIPESFQKKLDKYLWTMKQNCYRLLRLINNFIDLTKVDSGYLKPDVVNYNIVSIIENITLSVADYIENRGVDLIFDTNTEEKIMAFDADKIERIMLNILSNAIKFTKCGDVITVNLTDLEDSVTISVKDTGTGIPEDKLNIIFDRFAQVDRSLARNHEGSGIGLALVKSLIDIHGGNIEAKSVYGQGSEFIISFPVKLVEEKEQFDKNLYESNIERIRIEFSDIYGC